MKEIKSNEIKNQEQVLKKVEEKKEIKLKKCFLDCLISEHLH